VVAEAVVNGVVILVGLHFPWPIFPKIALLDIILMVMQLYKVVHVKRRLVMVWCGQVVIGLVPIYILN
jgi:hypothetical protein